MELVRKTPTTTVWKVPALGTHFLNTFALELNRRRRAAVLLGEHDWTCVDGTRYHAREVVGCWDSTLCGACLKLTVDFCLGMDPHARAESERRIEALFAALRR